MNLAGVQRFSTIDYPGRMAAVLFTQGCDMDCFYCHNRPLIAPGPGGMREQEAFKFLASRQGLLEGVVVSGGEPLLQKDLPDFVRKIRALGFPVKLDTNGQHPDRLEPLLQDGLLDYVAVDVKALESAYQRVCRVHGYARALETLALLERSGVPYEARTTLYPGMTAEELLTLAATLPALPAYRLNYFRMPANAPQDDRFSQPALGEAEVWLMLDGLRQFQPNLIF